MTRRPSRSHAITHVLSSNLPQLSICSAHMPSTAVRRLVLITTSRLHWLCELSRLQILTSLAAVIGRCCQREQSHACALPAPKDIVLQGMAPSAGCRCTPSWATPCGLPTYHTRRDPLPSSATTAQQRFDQSSFARVCQLLARFAHGLHAVSQLQSTCKVMRALACGVGQQGEQLRTEHSEEWSMDQSATFSPSARSPRCPPLAQMLDVPLPVPETCPCDVCPCDAWPWEALAACAPRFENSACAPAVAQLFDTGMSIAGDVGAGRAACVGGSDAAATLCKAEYDHGHVCMSV